MEGLRQKKEEKQMNYMDFAPHLIRERNEQVQREVNSLRLEERLREDRGSSGSQIRCPRQEVREAAAARGTPRGVAMVT